MLNVKQFQKIYDDFLESGLTVKDFCSNQGMNSGKFFYWQNKLKAQLPPKKGFVPIVVNHENSSKQFPVSPDQQFRQAPLINTSPTRKDSTFCEITFPNGVSVKFNEAADLKLIQSLIFSNTGHHV